MQNGAVIEENEAQNGGGVYNLGPDIPGFVRPTLTMIDSAISRNEADDLGGGILNDNGIVTLQNSTVFANDANDLGGGIFNTDGGTVTLDALSGVGGNKPNNCTGTTACAA
jgi:hypothetical protein